MNRAKTDLGSRAARLKLKPKAKPYFVSVEPKLTLGYVNRKPAPGYWIARRETGRTCKNGTSYPTYTQCRLGLADDITEADGENVLSYPQAAAKALNGERKGPLTVRSAIAAYTANMRARTGEAAARATAAVLRNHVINGRHKKSALADLRVADLSQGQVRQWLEGLVVPGNERASKASANRILANFKAALNLAYSDPANNIPSNRAWASVKAFRKVDGRRMDHFTEAECARLIDTARRQNPAFADLLEAAFFTGCRYGELTPLDVRHFDPRRLQLHIPSGKTGARDVVLTAEAGRFFAHLTSGKKPADILLPRPDGERWRKTNQCRPMKLALAAAALPPSAVLYSMRHTHASRAIENGQPLTLLAANLGTSVAMLERTYAHSLALTRRELVEKTAPMLRIVEGAKRAA